MSLNLMYITNNPDVAVIAEKYGVNRIWIDLETFEKQKRQAGRNTVISHHCISDISCIKPRLKNSEMLVRINPWNENSAEEINKVIAAGADIIMLPYWKTYEEVRAFTEAVGGRVKTTLLLETREATECIDKVLELKFDEIHIGLNDLHLSYNRTFMFELLSDGTVEWLCCKFKDKGIPFGFGGIARLGEGLLPAEKVIAEHYRLGSTRAILSRTFCDTSLIKKIDEIENVFKMNMKSFREYEKKVLLFDKNDFDRNREEVISSVNKIVEAIRGKN